MPRRSVPVTLSEAEFHRLDQWIRAGATPQQVVLRAKIIRSVAEGQSDKSVSAALAVRRETVALWRSRVREHGIGCVWEIAPGRGRKPRYDAAQVGRWINATLQTKPAGGTRTQPGLPLKPGRCGTYTHDYHRHGTTTLFAALQVAEGRVIGQCYPRHRHQEFLKFLRRLDGEFPPGKTLHLILDNYGTHGHPRVRRWLQRHPRFVLHFIPTSSSWLNLIERWFAELEQKAVRRAAFRSVPEPDSCS